jgi:cytochrome c-type biogenesis protein CcmH/NrfF
MRPIIASSLNLHRHPSESWGLRRLCTNALDTSFRRYGELVLLFCALMICITAPLHAQGTGPTPTLANQQLADRQQEAAATRLMHALRCIQCQGQSIADSDAPMAATMRAEVRQQIAGGQTPETIKQSMIGRYGEWVSFEPEMKGGGMLLWAAPLLLLAIAMLLARGMFRRRT